MYMAREIRIASVAAEQAVENVDHTRTNIEKNGGLNVQFPKHLNGMRVRSNQAEQILQMAVRTAESLGMDLSEGD